MFVFGKVWVGATLYKSKYRLTRFLRIQILGGFLDFNIKYTKKIKQIIFTIPCNRLAGSPHFIIGGPDNDLDHRGGVARSLDYILTLYCQTYRYLNIYIYIYIYHQDC